MKASHVVLSVALTAAAVSIRPLAAAGALKGPVASVEFVSMPAPATVEERADIYSAAQVIVTRIDGTSTTHALKYHLLSPWNTHLGSEEYEPDAKVRGGFAGPADGNDDTTDLNNFSLHYFGATETANPYHYGLVPEVTVTSGGVAVQKHHALGRIARELVDVQPDRRTAYMGDDGAYTSLFMFIADQGGNLSRGTLYAARWTQTSDANGGAATLAWVRLGHATDREIEALVASGITFGDIFDVSNVDPLDATFTKVKTYNGTEWLRLKPGAEKAAAFLETRRSAAPRPSSPRWKA